METTTQLAEIGELTIFRLAGEADCAGPDSPDSPGSRFLDLVRDAFVEHVEYQDEGYQWDGDDAHEIADGAVPIYTHDVWGTFVDLAAYTEDVTELGADASDMEQCAKVALYMIADRLVSRLAEMLEEDES